MAQEGYMVVVMPAASGRRARLSKSGRAKQLWLLGGEQAYLIRSAVLCAHIRTSNCAGGSRNP